MRMLAVDRVYCGYPGGRPRGSGGTGASVCARKRRVHPLNQQPPCGRFDSHDGQQLLQAAAGGRIHHADGAIGCLVCNSQAPGNRADASRAGLGEGADVSYTTDWTEPELKRFLLRVGLFERRGMTNESAELLAEKCLEREREGDWKDMHACVECAHWQSGERCAVTRMATITTPTMHRCEHFSWQVPRQEVTQ